MMIPPFKMVGVKEDEKAAGNFIIAAKECRRFKIIIKRKQVTPTQNKEAVSVLTLTMPKFSPLLGNDCL